jgi:hypothetical protein
MRVAAFLLLGVLLFPTAAAVGLGSVLPCCCAPKAGASCPMKRKAAYCAKTRAGSCGLRRAEPVAAAAPILAAPRPVLVHESVVPLVRVARVSYGAPAFAFATRNAQAPEPPPPKRA